MLKVLRQKLFLINNCENNIHKIITICGIKIKVKKSLKNFTQCKLNINNLILWVGTKCTLKCKNCCNLIPYSEQKSFDYLNILNDLKKIYNVANINLLQIQGGEPFTHPYIDKIINEIGKLDINEIQIATNATLLLNDNTIKTLQNNPQIQIRISDYECVKKQRLNFIKQLEENNIKYSLYDFENNDKTWFNSGGVNEKRANDDEVINIYKKCLNKHCHLLYDGNLAVCGKIPIIREIYGDQSKNKYEEINVRKYKNNIFKKKLLKKALDNFYKKSDSYREACRYCIEANERIPAAIQLTNNELSEFKKGKQDENTNPISV